MANKSSRITAFGRKQPVRRHATLLIFLTLVSLVLSACGVNDLSLPTSIPLPNFNGDDEQKDVQPTAVPDESPRGGILIDLPPTWTPSSAPETTPVTPPVTTSGENPSTQTYIVQTGDTLAGIALQFNVSLSVLAQVNNITDLDHIELGQELIIPRQ